MPEDTETQVAQPRDVATVVADWFSEHIANSPVSRSVEAINHMTQVAIPALIVALNGKV